MGVWGCWDRECREKILKNINKTSKAGKRLYDSEITKDEISKMLN